MKLTKNSKSFEACPNYTDQAKWDASKAIKDSLWVIHRSA
jgi:hypothetical protein